jgi:hypothetical protein
VVTSPLKSRPPVQRAALAIVRRCPAAWRDRYESEVDGLIEDSSLAGSERGIRSAQQLVDGCHGMIAKGVPSPLAEAEAALTKAKRFREDAFERLQALGYRARFRPVDGGPRTEVSPMERGGTAPGKS